MSKIPATAYDIACAALGRDEDYLGTIDVEELTTITPNFLNPETGESLRFKDIRDKTSIDYTFLAATTDCRLAFRRSDTQDSVDYEVAELRFLECKRPEKTKRTPEPIRKARAKRHMKSYMKLNPGVKRKPLNNDRIGGQRRMD